MFTIFYKSIAFAIKFSRLFSNFRIDVTVRFLKEITFNITNANKAYAAVLADQVAQPVYKQIVS